MGLRSDGFGAVWGRLREARDRDPALFRLQVCLGFALALLIGFVLTGDPSHGVPERLSEGKPLRGVDYWRTYGWWTALVNAGLLTVLLVTARRWFSRGPVSESAELAPPRRVGRGFVVVVAAAMLAGAALAAPRLSQSFWDDEEYNVMYSIDGSYFVDDSGEANFHPVRWRDTLWFYSIPNNHVAHTILARFSLHGWRAITRSEAPFANEAVVRLPAFLAGIAAIASIALLLRRIGYAGAGVFAAWLLALHPWHTRYTSEARGYSMVLLLLTASLTLLVNALYRGTWGRWALFGLAQFLLLWTYPGLVFHLIVVNAVAAAAIWHLHGRTPQLGQQFGRWAMVNLFGALVWLQLMIPNLAQVPAYLEKTAGSRNLGIRWVKSVLSHFFSGMPWNHGRRATEPVYPQLIDVLQQTPSVFWIMLMVVLLAMTVGTLRLFAAGGVRALLVAILLLPGPITYLLSWLRGDNIYIWYMVFMVPSLVMLVAIGLFSFVPSRLGPRLVGAVTAVAAVGFLSGHFWLTGPARRALHDRSFKPARESAQIARPNLDPRTPENRHVLTVGYRSAFRFYYDPRLEVVEDPQDLRAAMQRADREGRPLFVNFGYLGRVRRHQPELMAILEDEERFEQLALIHAFEPPWTRAVFRYRGASEGPAVAERASDRVSARRASDESGQGSE